MKLESLKTMLDNGCVSGEVIENALGWALLPLVQSIIGECPSFRGLACGNKLHVSRAICKKCGKTTYLVMIGDDIILRYMIDARTVDMPGTGMVELLPEQDEIVRTVILRYVENCTVVPAGSDFDIDKARIARLSKDKAEMLLHILKSSLDD